MLRKEVEIIFESWWDLSSDCSEGPGRVLLLCLLLLFLLQTDTWANSCIPEIITTFDPTFDTQTPEMEFSVSNSAYSASSPDFTTHAPTTTRAPPSTSMAWKTKKICFTEVYTEPNTVAAETEPPVESGAAFKNEAPGFGGECLLGLLGMGNCVWQTNSHHPVHPLADHSAPTRHKQKLNASSASIDS